MKFTPRPWTQEEDAILKQHYPSMGMRVQTMFSNRSYESVRTRAARLGLRADDAPQDWRKRQRRAVDPTPEEIEQRKHEIYRRSIEASLGYDRLLRYGEYAQ